MGIFICAFLILIFGIISLIIYKRKYSKYIFKGDNWLFLGMVCTVIAGAVIITCGIICLIINSEVSTEMEYQNMFLERTSIEYRLEQAETENSFLTNGGVYYDAVQFNNDLRAYKTYTHNFWVGWFWMDKPAELDYIELNLEGS